MVVKPERRALVFGAGKTGRGFIAHLLALSGYRIAFVEKAQELVALLRKRGKYQIHIMGAPEKDIAIGGFETLSSQEEELIADRIISASVVFVSIGGPNLPEIAPQLARGVGFAAVKERREPLNVILCENYFQPGKWLRQLVRDRLTGRGREWFDRHVGIVEALVLRSSVEPTPEMKLQEPLSLQAQDLWEMPADKGAFVGDVPQVEGLVAIENFQGALIRKLFTYNAINAVIAYPGYLKGYQLLSEAANDPELIKVARQASEESGEALCKTFGFDPQEQKRMGEAAIEKFQKREIVDPIERNAHDPLRKLGLHDRLIGPACLALESGIKPVALSQAIGAALHYDHPSDSAAQALQATIREKGVRGAIREVCEIDPEGELGKLVIAAFQRWSVERER